MKRSSSAAFAVLLTACTTAKEPTRPKVQEQPLVIPPVASLDAGKRTSACRLVGTIETIDDGDAKADEYGQTDLDNVRALADDTRAIVTWERQSNYKVGDSWHAPIAMIIGDPKIARLPVHAYACATYSYGAPLAFDEPVVVWGELNTRAFETWKTLPEVKEDGTQGGSGAVTTPTVRSVPTKQQSVGGFVASNGFVLAKTSDTTCKEMCNCEGPWSASIWLYRLDADADANQKKPFAKRLVTTPDNDKRPDAPALAIGTAGGVAAYRFKGALWVVWVDAKGTPSEPVKLATGDVGAPAVAVAGNEAVLSWVERAAKADPYQLRWLRMPLAGTIPAPHVLATDVAAFAPAVIADATSQTITWMEGDASRKGEIRIARITGETLGERFTVSTGEPNARDPELSGSAARPFLVYSTFTKEKPGGVVRYTRLACD